MRLDKYLADAGCGTRSEVRKLIQSGRVLINGEAVRNFGTQIEPEADNVVAAGEIINFYKHVYYMLNKPAGVVSATNDNTCETVLDILKKDTDNKPLLKGVFPVGRLDKDTEGLLLITNDGALAHRLLAPGRHVDKMYYAKVSGIVDGEDVQAFLDGIDIGEKAHMLPAYLEIISTNEDMYSEVRITIREGKFHQIKRMFHKRGKNVLYLKRLTMGNLVLDETLKSGQWRILNQDEINLLTH